jgi:hypothetical protein
MAITTNAITNSFKEDLLQGVQTFVAGGGDTFKLALYDQQHLLVQIQLPTQ